MIQIVVEGKGEVAAAPTLIRRLLWELQVYSIPVSGESQFCPKNQMTQIPEEFKRRVNLARYNPQITALLFLFDADDDCARKYLPNMKQWISEANPNFPIGIVMVTREYEAWFLAALESLRGWHGIPLDATYEGDPEAKRDAKGALRQFLPEYRPSILQTAVSAQIDLNLAYQNASTFRRLVNEICRLVRLLGSEPIIPENWN